MQRWQLMVWCMCTVIAVLLWAPDASASCVVVDEAQDQLAPEERAAAQHLFEEALRDAGVSVEPAPCDDTITLMHVRLGQKLFVTATRADARERGEAASIEALPPVYAEVVSSLTGTTGTTGATTGTTGATTGISAGSAPRTPRSDSLFYGMLGYATTFDHTTSNGPTAALGYRYELDQFAIDASISGTFSPLNDDEVSAQWTLLRLGGLIFFDPLSARSLYAGGGLGFGASHLQADGEGALEGYGIHFEPVLGLALLRDSRVRMLFEAKLIIPTYKARATSDENTSNEDAYPLAGALAFGVGFH